MTGRCPSSTHDEDATPPPATIPGVFDCSHVNGREPERITYCLRCATALGVFGMFTADDPGFDPWSTRKSA